MTPEILMQRYCYVPSKSEIAKIDSLEANAEKGDSSAVQELYDLYEQGHYIPRDGKKFVKLLLTNVYRDDNFYCNIGSIYFYGDGISRDFGKAVWWLKRAANCGNSEAMYLLGDIYLTAEKNQKHSDVAWFIREDEIFKNFHLAFYWFNRCFESYCYGGNPRRYDLCFYGFGLHLEYDRAFEVFLETLKMPRYSELLYCMGEKYFKGLDVQRSIDEAIQWFTRAAAHGSNKAIRTLGRIYREGDGVPQNIDRAVFWYEKTNQRDYLKGRYEIAKMYKDGVGIEKNPEKACDYFDTIIRELI